MIPRCAIYSILCRWTPVTDLYTQLFSSRPTDQSSFLQLEIRSVVPQIHNETGRLGGLEVVLLAKGKTWMADAADDDAVVSSCLIRRAGVLFIPSE